MRKVSIYFDHDLDLLDIMECIKAKDWELRGDPRGRLVVQSKARAIDAELANVVPLRGAPCER